MTEAVKWPLGLKSLHELGLAVVHLGRKEFAELYPPAERLKHIMSNRGSQPIHVKTETGFRVDVPSMHKLMQDQETQVYSVWAISED